MPDRARRTSVAISSMPTAQTRQEGRTRKLLPPSITLLAGGAIRAAVQAVVEGRATRRYVAAAPTPIAHWDGRPFPDFQYSPSVTCY